MAEAHRNRRVGRTRSSSRASADVRYGGPVFSQAAALPLRGGLGSRSRVVSLHAEAVRHPRRIAELIVVIFSTRSERVVLSESAAGRALRAYFDQRCMRILPQNQLCRGVLILPSDHAEYLRGRRRQALRTNLRRAATAGISCERIDDHADGLRAAGEILDHRRTSVTDGDRASLRVSWPALFARPEVTLMVARDEDGHALAMSAAVIDENVALILVAVASSHDARWALHDHLAQDLIDRGVKFLLVEGDGPLGALGFATEVHHYQHLLGYQLRHLVPNGSHRPCVERSVRKLLAAFARMRAIGLVLCQREPGVRSKTRP